MRKDIKDQIDSTKFEVLRRVEKLGQHPFGHAFLWGYVSAKFKNGKERYYKTCIGGICVDDLSLAVKIANSVPGVKDVWYNMD